MHHAAPLHIAEGGAEQPNWIDAEMVVEAAVFGGDHSSREIGRELVEPHTATAQAALGEHGAFGGEDGEIGRPVVEGEEHGIR